MEKYAELNKKMLYNLNPLYRFEIEIGIPGGNIEKYLDLKIGLEKSRFTEDKDVLLKREKYFKELKENFDEISQKKSFEYLNEKILIVNSTKKDFYKVEIKDENLFYRNLDNYVPVDTEKDFYREFRKTPMEDENETGLLDTRRLGKSNFSCFIIDECNVMYIFPYRSNSIHHTYITNGNPVKLAGMLRIEEGKICYIDNKSGHYCPNAEDINIFFDYLLMKNGGNKIKNLFYKDFSIKEKNFSNTALEVFKRKEFGLNLFDNDGNQIKQFLAIEIRNIIEKKYFFNEIVKEL